VSKGERTTETLLYKMWEIRGAVMGRDEIVNPARATILGRLNDSPCLGRFSILIPQKVIQATRPKTVSFPSVSPRRIPKASKSPRTTYPSQVAQASDVSARNRSCRKIGANRVTLAAD
jgi:hypothetical protein